MLHFKCCCLRNCYLHVDETEQVNAALEIRSQSLTLLPVPTILLNVRPSIAKHIEINVPITVAI